MGLFNNPPSPVTVVDAGDVAQGATTDAAVSTDANGTINAHIRGLVKLLASILGTAGAPSVEAVTVQGIAAAQPVITTFNLLSFRNSGVFVPTASASQFPSKTGSLFYLTACKTNTGLIYIGGSTVTSTVNATNATTGLELQAGQQVGPFPLTNLNTLWAIGTVATDAVTYLVM